MLVKHALCLALLSTWALAQADPPARPAKSAASTSTASLSQDEIRELIRKAAVNDMENDKKLRDYTYLERDEQHILDGKGQVKSTHIKTFEIMEIYSEPVRKLIAKDDKPLSEKDAKKEDKKIQELIDKRRDESAEDRKKHLEKEEKDREEDRQFVREVADAYNYKLVGVATIDGREDYVIDGEPKPGFEPHLKQAKILPKFRYRAWVDKDETQWKKLDIECIDTVSWGWFIARVHKGSRIVLEQTRVNDEVWLPQHTNIKIDAKLALLKQFDMDLDIGYRDYKKFRAETKIIPGGEVSEQP
jgi:hypothetical protein